MDGREQPDVVVIGGGIAGLCAAAELAAAGLRALVLEKARGVGGRMATRRIGAAVCDHGAQFFTVRGDEFGGLVSAAEADGAVARWCDGFVPADAAGAAVASRDGHARWRGVRGMTDLSRWLATRLAQPADRPGCTIRIGAKVAAVAIEANGVGIVLEDDEPIAARGAIITAPVPQALDLLAAGGMGRVDAEAGRTLERVSYDPCFAAMLVLDRPSRVPAPGGIQFAPGSGPVAWLADNALKGVSPVPALTVHATGGFSREHFDSHPDDVVRILVEAVRPWIDGDPDAVVVERSLHRWRFALPTTIVPERLVVASAAPPVACCGDAFAGPRVEGAAASGTAAGRWMARTLG